MLTYKDQKIYADGKAVTLEKMSVCYTLKSDDLRAFERPECSPYGDRKAYFGGEAEKLGFTLSAEEKNGGLEFCLGGEGGAECAEFGVNLPLDFMGKKGGNWKEQYLFNSPYRSRDNKHIYLWLTNPSRKGLLILFESDADGWKMDYSPYVGGHYFYNLRLLASFPKEYGTGCCFKTLRFYVCEADDFREAVKIAAKIKNLPVLLPEVNAAAVGEKLRIEVIGDCDEVEFCGRKYPVEAGRACVEIIEEGMQYVVPYKGGKAGFECSVYGYRSLRELYKRWLDGILRDGLVNHYDEPSVTTHGRIWRYDNLCEGQCWLSAMLRYMSRYGYVKEYAEYAENALKEIMCDDESKAIPRYSVLSAPQPDEGLPAYNVYKSQRVQEQFFAVGIFLDAWRALGDGKYLEWAEKTLDSVLDFHQREDGRIETYTAWLGKYEDYSTVCSPMINIVDMYRAECGRNEEKSARYAASAKRLAEYLCKRGLSFPTEGGADERAEAEMEDGSISCTALSLLYYDRYVEKSPRFVEKAREILDWHESWVVNTPLCCMQGSSLRWWETNWEGDKDGPALCMGHAWTIWRAEADLLMYEATGEREYLRKAECGFNTNFAKIHADGRSYTVFQIDYITGWRYFRAEEVRYELAKEFPEQFDNGTTGYVWTRAADAFLDRKEKTL